jgi:hypothetical protein
VERAAAGVQPGHDARGLRNTSLLFTLLSAAPRRAPLCLLCFPAPAAEDIQALQSLLEATSNALIASHILHLMCHCFTRADPPDMTPEQMQREWVAGVVGWGGGWAPQGCVRASAAACVRRCVPPCPPTEVALHPIVAVLRRHAS